MTLTWISSDGGPLLLVEKSLVSDWQGVSTLQTNGAEDGPPADYDRACSIEDYVGLIAVGTGEALVLGDEPMQTSWLAVSDREGILIRWQWAADEESVRNTLHEIIEAAWESTDVRFEIKTGELLLFDAAYPGDEIESSLVINLSAGEYSVNTAFWRPEDETSLILHRLRR
ncbi:MAG TPA: Imm21 family immunity protein [Pyrinomonadaceae bacterium]